MGKIIEFPKQRDPPAEVQGPWKFCHLRGLRPPEHPEVLYGPRGKVLIAPGQVWVSVHSEEMVVITRIFRARRSHYPHDVVYKPYHGSDMQLSCVSEATFRMSNKVWEEYVIFLKNLTIKLNRVQLE